MHAAHRVMLCLWAAAAALGAEPQCPTSGMRPCLRRIGDGRFDEYYWPGRLNYETNYGWPFLHEAVPAEAVCSKAAHDGVHACASTSDLRLTIVEPAEFRSSMPLHSFVPVPWVDTAHIDQHHPVNGKVMDLVGPANGSDACDWRNWMHPWDVSGQIVVTRYQGACPSTAGLFYAKYFTDYHKLPPPVAAIHTMGSGETLFPYRVSWAQNGFGNIPRHMGPGALSYMVAEAAAKGQKLRGKIELVCPTPGGDGDAGPAAAEFTDGCPDDRLRGLCHNMPDPEDRLCSKCPLQLKHARETVCLYGSRLVPSRAAHFFQATRSIPAAVELVYVALPPWAGCQASDFDGVSGKVAVFSYRGCMTDSAGALNAARLAEQQGATGIVLLSPRLTYFMLSGPGLLHGVPIHVVEGAEAHIVLGWFGAEDRYEVNTATLTADLVDEDTAPDPVLPPAPAAAAPAFVVPADASSFEPEAGPVTLIVVAVLLVGAIGGKLAAERRRATEGAVGVPLSVASMLLSVSLLVVSTVIACSLSARAAREATDAAAANGETATRLTYDAAGDNAARMSREVLSLAVGQVTVSLQEDLRAVLSALYGLHELFNWWDGSWFWFKFVARIFYGQATFKEIRKGSSLHTCAQTLEGFYFDSLWMTDYSSENASRTLEELQSAKAAAGGFVTGLRMTSRRQLHQGAYPLWAAHQMEDSPLKRIGGELVDPVAEVKRLGLGPLEHAWRVASQGVPFTAGATRQMPFVTVSAIMPLFDEFGEEFRGALTAVMDVENFYKLLRQVRERDTAHENMTALVYDTQTEILVGSSNHPTVHDLAETVDLFFDQNSMAPHFQALAVSKSAEVADNALHNYLLAHPSAAARVDGELDQRDYYSHPDLHLLNIAVGSAGAAADASGHALPLEMRMGRCGRCVVSDAAHGQVMRFDGGNTLYVDLNLTTDVAYVAAKRRGSGSDPWASDDPLYAHAMPVDSSTRKMCIYRNTTLNEGLYGCSMRGVAAFPQRTKFTLSVRVKPDADVAADDREQLLFQHSPEGISDVTLYASGALVVGNLDGVCVIAGVGLPGGVWTTVTARYHRWDLVCEVFLNGTRFGARHSSALVYSASRSAFAIGTGFVGAVQSVRAYPFLADPESLSQGGAFVRHVPSKRWFFTVLNVTVAVGLDWTVSVRIPRDDVMRGVDASNAQLVSNLRQQAANTQGKLDRELAETVLVTAVVVLVSVLVFLVFNDLLTRPFAEVSSVMCDAAVMRIEEVPERQSWIAELNAMQAATRLMLASLKEYKSYMPQHIVAEPVDKGAVDDESDEVSVMSIKSVEVEDELCDVSVNTTSPATEHVHRTRPAPRHAGDHSLTFLALRLTTRKVSLAVLNIVGFARLVRTQDEQDVLEMHGSLLLWLQAAANLGRGIIEWFSGDRFFVTFNASKITMLHRDAVGTLGCSFASHCQGVGLTPSAGLVSGDAKVGNMGCVTMRKFSCLSPLVPTVHALERHARNLQVGLLCDAALQRECRKTLVMRHAGQLRVKGAAGDATGAIGVVVVYQVLQPKGEGDGCTAEEWMYELDAADKGNAWREWDALVAAVVAGDWEAAVRLKPALGGTAGAKESVNSEGPLAAAIAAALEKREYVVPDYSLIF